MNREDFDYDPNDYPDGFDPELWELETRNQITVNNKQLNSITMNTKNVDYLKDQMKYLGFGESLHQPLTTAIENGHERFSLKLLSDATTAQGNTAKFELFFNKSKDTDMYFFNTYKTELTDKNGNQYKQNSFSVEGTKSITAKESINLLEGRAVKTVFKFNGEDTELFAKLDFENKTEKGNYKFNFYNKNYGVDVKEILGKSHIVFADQNENENLIKSLEKGNLVPSKFVLKGAETTGFVSLNVQYKTMDYFTDDLKPVYTKNLGQGPEANKTTTQKVDPDANPLLSKEENEVAEALLDDIDSGKGIGKKNGKATEEVAIEEAPEKSNGRKR